MHPSCCVNCREGEITVEQAYFEELSAACEQDGMFKSPQGACRMGFSQTYKAKEVTVVDADSDADSSQPSVDEASDPIAVLKADHNKLKMKFFVIEDQLRRRDLDGLWETTAEIEDEIMLHSAKKEELVLFPVIKDLLPLGEGLFAIVKEDHSEILSLLNSFRAGLEDGDILDGIIVSMMVGLRSHIRKEDYEFFALVEKCLDDETKKRLIDGFDKVVREHIPLVHPPRTELTPERIARRKERQKFHESVNAVRDQVHGGGCCD